MKTRFSLHSALTAGAAAASAMTLFTLINHPTPGILI